MAENVLLGIQGWDHAQWIGQSYSPAIGSSARLGEYSQRFPTVEVDDTFYGIPPEPVLRRWRDSVPKDFSFALKAPQQITHEQRFSGQGGLLKRFLDRVSMLEGNLGPVLLLAPLGFEPDNASRAILRDFIKELPTGFRWALELRHMSWFTDELHDLLTSRNVAIVIGINRWTRRASMMDLATTPTADFAYVRWNDGPQANAPAEPLDSEEHVTTNWAGTLEKLSSLVEVVYGYFNISAFGDCMPSAEELPRRVS